MNATLRQTIHLLTLLADKMEKESGGRSGERIQELVNSGLLTDLFEIKDFETVDRDQFRALLGLSPLEAFLFTVKTEGQPEVDIRRWLETRWLETVLWKFQCVNQNFPVYDYQKVGTRVAGDKLCVPITRFGSIAHTLEHFDIAGYVPADFPQTLATFLATNKRGAFICPMSVALPSQGPVGGIESGGFFVLARKEESLYLFTERLTAGFFQRQGDSLVLGPGRHPLRLKKREIYVVLAKKD